MVPRLNGEYATMAAAKFGLEALVIGPGVKTGMPILTSDPRQVGPDLIVDAVAAYELYGGPCIAVDFGTATTFSAVSATGEYLGHAIAPGIEISLDALATRAARLLKIELADPGSVIGKNTVHAMQAGAVYGFAGQVDGIVTRMRAGTGRPAVTVATGGLAFAHLRSRFDPRQARPAAHAQGSGDHLPAEPLSRRRPGAAASAASRPAAPTSPPPSPSARSQIPNRVVLAPMAGLTSSRLSPPSQGARRRAGDHRDGQRVRPHPR